VFTWLAGTHICIACSLPETAAETLSGPNDIDIDIEWWLSALNSRNAPLKLIKYACDH